MSAHVVRFVLKLLYSKPEKSSKERVWVPKRTSLNWAKRGEVEPREAMVMKREVIGVARASSKAGVMR